MPLLVVSAINIFSLPLFYRFLGEEMYALAGYIITFTGFFGFADLGLGSAVGRYIGIAFGKGDTAAVREYWGTGNLMALPLLAFMGLMFMLLGAVFGPFWFDKVSPENIGLLRACFVVGGLGLFLSAYGQLWNILLQAHIEFKFSSLVRVGTSLLQIVPAIGIAWATHSPLWIGVWSVVANALQLAILVWYIRYHHGLGFSLRAASRKRAHEMALYTVKAFATLIAGSFLGSVDRLMLGRLAPAAAFNPYFISANVGGRLQGLGSAVMGPVFHNTSRAVGGGRVLSAAAIYDEMFTFTFGWYLLAAIWTAIWHPVVLHLWLGGDLASRVAPLFTPMIVGFCLTALASISGAQLGPLDRMGTLLGFNIAVGLLTAIGVYVGWRLGGVVGVAYGFLASRTVFLAQDIYVIRLVKATGWFNRRIWLAVVVQGLIGGVFALLYLVVPANSIWLLVPAVLHAGLVGTWLLRHPLRRHVGLLAFRSLRGAASTKRSLKS